MRFTIESYFMLVGFIGLVSSMQVMLLTIAERKFWNSVYIILSSIREKRRNIEIGKVQLDMFLNKAEDLLPDGKRLRRIINFIIVILIIGLLVYSYAVLALFKKWINVNNALLVFTISLFFFVFSGLLSYFMNRRIVHLSNKLIGVVKQIDT